MQGIFNDDAFAKIKPGARIVNVARGGVIDDAALARALDGGKVAQVSWPCYNLSLSLSPSMSLSLPLSPQSAAELQRGITNPARLCDS